MKKCFIIAEAGVNHNGSLALARRLVDAAADAGADAIKFQTFRTESLAIRAAPKARYQRAATGRRGSQFDMLKHLELGAKAHYELAARCRRRKIQFLSTPFDEESLLLLHAGLRVPRIKISSGELTNGPLLLAAARTRRPLILSTGMGTLEEVRAALQVLAVGYTSRTGRPTHSELRKALGSSAARDALSRKLTLLHCTTEYPAPAVDVNLRAMDTLRTKFAVPVGYSDHTTGIHTSIAAVARGASLIEKHLTLDRGLPGPDHKASLEPEEFDSLVHAIREVELSLGSGVKAPAASERKNIAISRRSIVALRPIAKGERLTKRNIGCKRPASGISPMRFWEALDRKATKDYQKDELIEL